MVRITSTIYEIYDKINAYQNIHLTKGRKEKKKKKKKGVGEEKIFFIKKQIYITGQDKALTNSHENQKKKIINTILLHVNLRCEKATMVHQ